MKIKSLMMMTMAAVAIVMGVSSCGGDDDVPEAPVAAQVAGSYTGSEILTVSGEVDESTEAFVFSKATDVSVDVTLPEYGEGMMTIPALPVKGIVLTKSGDTIAGKLDKYEGTTEAGKAYVVTDVAVIFSDNTVVMTFKMKYGNMPFEFEGLFTGTRSVK
jgi:hypothetical protein